MARRFGTTICYPCDGPGYPRSIFNVFQGVILIIDFIEIGYYELENDARSRPINRDYTLCRLQLY